MSKGSAQRPTDREKFNDNWEIIFGNRKDKETDGKDKEINPAASGGITESDEELFYFKEDRAYD